MQVLHHVLCWIVVCCLLTVRADPSSFEASDNPTYQFLASPTGKAEQRRDKHTLTDEEYAWVAQGDLASAVNVSTVSELVMRVHINLFLVGFDGEGNMGVKMDNDAIDSWLEHLDHVAWHTSFPVSEMESEVPIRYKYEYETIEVDPGYIKVLEAVRASSMRPNEDDDGNTVDYQVDAQSMAAELDAFVRFLGMDDSQGYNLFVLSPNALPDNAFYGYRLGFSDSELDELIADENVIPSYVQRKPLPDLGPRSRSREGSRGDSMKRSKLWVDTFFLLFEDDLPSPLTVTEYAMRAMDTPHMRAYLEEILLDSEFLQENCLVDTWITTERNLFIDLTAAGLEWGPCIHGEGMRTVFSTPTVDSFLNEDQLTLQHYEQTKKNSESHFEIVASLTTKTGKTKAHEWTQQKRDTNFLEAERLVVVDQLQRLCEDEEEQKQPRKCEELLKQYQLVSSMLTDTPTQVHSLTHRNAFTFFSDRKDNTENTSLALQHLDFFSRLSAVMSNTIQHVITPSVVHANDTSGVVPITYADTVSFHVYLISAHEADAEDIENLETKELYDKIQRGLMALKLYKQEFSFVFHHLSLDSDPAVAMAFQSSLKSTVVPRVHYDGITSSVKRMYLDSELLQNALLHTDLGTPTDLSGKHDHLPIFIFSVDMAVPVFVDTHYQSVALSRMIVSVQSSQHLWESPNMCNGNPVYWNLRDPSRSIIASAAQYLAGLSPLHTRYSAAHDRLTTDYLWSVGASPLCITAKGQAFSQIQADAAHRAYALSAVTEAATMINAAVRRLQRKRATAQNVYISTFCFDREQGYDDEQLLNTCDASNNALSKVPALVKDAWEVITSMSTAVETLEFQDACDLIPLLETRSAALDAYVTRIEEQVAVYGCSSALKPSKIPEVYALTLSHYLTSVALCLLVVLVKLINPKKAKPKLN